MKQRFQIELIRLFSIRLMVVGSMLFIGGRSLGQKIEVNVNKDTIKIGESIELSLSYSFAKATSGLSFYEGDSLGDGFEVLEVVQADTNQNTVNFKVSVTNFELGSRAIPTFTVYYGDKKTSSTPIPIFVSLVELDTTLPFKDIKPILEDSLTSSDYIKMGWNWVIKYWWLVGLILFGLIGIILYYRMRKLPSNRIEESEKSIPLIPAHVQGIQSLKELEKKELWQKGNQKQYNVELTEIIQTYIFQRYQVPTFERTSSEIIHSLRFVEMGLENKQNLRKLLMLSDLVKFAKEKPTSHENESVMKEAYQFIETTKKESPTQ